MQATAHVRPWPSRRPCPGFVQVAVPRRVPRRYRPTAASGRPAPAPQLLLYAGGSPCAVLDPTSKEDRYSARIYIERSYRDLGNRRSEYNYILHYLEQSRKEPKCTKVRFPRLRVRTCTQRAPIRTQVLVPVQAFRSNSGIRTVLRTRLQVAKY